jgi:hypothetical protein
VKASIPFNFNVGSTTLPAGTYTVGENISSPNVLDIASKDRRTHIVAIAQPDELKKNGGNVMVFHCYGGHYFLTSIRSEQAMMNAHLPSSKAEKRAQTLWQDASLPVGSSEVLIALR